MPNFIWRTGEEVKPHVFERVRIGDRWIAFAYTTNDLQERPLSQITGFYECVEEARYGSLSSEARKLPGGYEKAWMIRGRPWGKQPGQPVGVPPIDELLQLVTEVRRHFKSQTLVPIKDGEEAYERIRDYTLERELKPADIPLLGREPRNEQEVLAVVFSCYRQLGIKKIRRVRTRFPDLLVEIEGHQGPVHLELETYSRSFLLHGHADHVCDRVLKTAEIGERLPVAVLCWIHDEKKKNLGSCVHKVYELQQLIREKSKIRW